MCLRWLTRVPTALICFVLLTGGCMHHNVQNLTADRFTERSITVPQGSIGLLGPIKEEFRARGWTQRTGAGPTITRLINDRALETFDTHNTRYKLVVVDNQYDHCLDLDRATNYEILIVDAQSGEEVLSISGRGCQSKAVRRFREALRQRS